MTIEETTRALARLFEIARSDTGQARRVADFLLAWWNAADWGGFDLADLFAVDTEIARDMAVVFAFLASRHSAIYADAFGYDQAMSELIARWHPERVPA